jgi:G3E family GTPase
LRVKGVLNVTEEEGPVVVHGVQHVFHPPVALRRWPDGDRTSRLVMIVRDLDRETIEKGWRSLSA